MKGQTISQLTTLAMVITGAILLWYSLNVGVTIGSDWFGKDATFQWHMNNYIVLDAIYAYSIFGLATMVIGGLATGLAMAAFFKGPKTTKHLFGLVTAFFVAITMTGLGFNTLDFMLGCFYWTNMQYPAPVEVTMLGSVDVWNYYFFFFVVPLWASGFMMGLASSAYVFLHRPKYIVLPYFAKHKLSHVSESGASGFVVESVALCRSNKIIRENLDGVN